MEIVRRVWRWVSFGWNRKARESELDAEIQFHLEEEAAEREASGLPPDEARRAAGLDLGNAAAVKESAREAWGWAAVESCLEDLRLGMRGLAKNRAFAVTAVASLALGIGANTAIYSIINAVMLRTLPMKNPRELVGLQISGKTYGLSFTNPQWEAIRDSQDAFAGVLAYSEERFDLAEGGESRYVNGLWVSGGYFDALGVPALRGRVLTNRDDRHGCGADGPVAVIGYDFWRTHFQADPGAVGRTLRLNRQAFTIVGVTPPWMKGLDKDLPYDVAIPIGCEAMVRPEDSALSQRSHWWLRIAGRLRPGATLEVTQSRMKALAPEIFRATVPTYWSPGAQQKYMKYGLALSPAATGFSEVGDRYRTALFALMAIAGLVLLIACVNIANLLLARAAARQRELSMRMALGASRWRLVRQLLTESLLLSTLGACGGFLLALWGGKALAGFISRSPLTRNPVELDLAPDWHLLAFTAAVAVLTALVFGLVPALRATRVGVNDALKEQGRGAVGGAGRFRLGRGLAALQIAVSFILLLAAGLFMGTLRNLLNADLGFRPEGVLLVNVDARRAAKDPAKRAGVYAGILERLRELPGVTSASTSMTTPLSGNNWNEWISSDAYGASPRPDALLYMNRVSPKYFQTVGTALLAGRDFNDYDRQNTPQVMVINESAAHQFFGAASPLGKTIRIGNADSRWRLQVIGVVKDAKYERVNEPAPIAGFVAMAQANPDPSLNYQLRHTISPDALAPAVRKAIAEVDPGITLEFHNFSTQVSESLQQQRLVAMLSTVFGALALLLSMVGLYGVTAYAVARRKGEIGLRMALGAPTGSVLWLILRGVAALLAAGTALGMAGALAAGKLVTSLLHGVKSNDPAEMLAAAALLALAVTLAACLPAWKAARLDPMKVLREE
jgi:putative ABC transport system permease protein